MSQASPVVENVQATFWVRTLVLTDGVQGEKADKER